MLAKVAAGVSILSTARVAESKIKELEMLHYSVVFLVIALIAAVFGFGGIAAGAVEIAKILFVIFVPYQCISFVNK